MTTTAKEGKIVSYSRTYARLGVTFGDDTPDIQASATCFFGGRGNVRPFLGARVQVVFTEDEQVLAIIGLGEAADEARTSTKEGRISFYSWSSRVGEVLCRDSTVVQFRREIYYGGIEDRPLKNAMVTVVFKEDNSILAVLDRGCHTDDPCLLDNCPFCNGGPGGT